MCAPASPQQALASLHAALDALDSVEVAGAPGAMLADQLLDLHRIASRLHAQLLRTTAAFDASGAWTADAAPSASAWLRHRARVTPGAARAQVRDAALLRDLMPRTAEALAEGAITPQHVQVLTRQVASTEVRREALAEGEKVLVDAARRLDPPTLSHVVKHWLHRVDAAGAALDDLDLRDGRHLAVSRTFEGAVAIDGMLDPEGGAVVQVALEAVDRMTRTAGDKRTPGQRRADALVALARLAIDNGGMLGLPVVGGTRPHIALTIPASVAADLAGSLTEGARLDRSGPISADAALRLLCDASVTPVVLDDAGQPLDVGRSRRTIPPHLRTAVVTRDRHCTFPGCDRPAAWCEVHHIVPWSKGGATSLENLTLVCQHHHHAVHEGGFVIRGAPHERTFQRADGSVLAPSPMRAEAWSGAPPPTPDP